MRRNLHLLSILACLAGCAGSEPPQSAGMTSAAFYDYDLPETSAKVTVQATIVECQPSATFKLEPTLTVTAVRGPAKYRLVGGDLASWFKSHDLALTSYDSGALKTLNSADADRTFAVITNVLKGVISLAAIAGTPNPTGIDCSAGTVKALAALKALKARRAALSDQLQTASAGTARGLAAAIPSVDAEIGRLATSDDLRFELPAKDIDLTVAGGEVSWAKNDMPKALANPIPAYFTLAYCLKEQQAGEAEAACTAADLASRKGLAGAAPPTQCGNDTTCSHTIVMREPKRGILTLVGKGVAFGKQMGKPVKSVALPVAQWGEATMLSTDVGLGKSRTVGFGLDEYGNRTSFTWKSDARAESITGGVASALEPAATLAGKVRDAQLTADKAELDRLDTGQKLAKARACQAILDGGGTCPKD